MKALCAALALITATGLASAFDIPSETGPPRHYICPRTATAPVIDGELNDPVWQRAPWTEDFVDIQGSGRPAPRHRTRARLLWDDRFLYVAAELVEPHVWATLTERDSVIYHDNDFELFLDPDGDNHQYYELEINALGTVWDLLLIRPYRDGGPAVHAWDIRGLRSAVQVQGTLNDPSDRDRSWTVELGLPWEILKECAHRRVPPQPGDRWRLNFSRVQWRTEVADRAYKKVPGPEDNWVWSPQGLINMHYPERWGFLQFALEPGEEPVRSELDVARACLMELYYRQRKRQTEKGRFTDQLRKLGFGKPRGESLRWPPRLQATEDRFLISLTTRSGQTVTVDQEGRLRLLPTDGASR